MKTQESTRNMKRHFVWPLTILMLIGLLGMASMSLAAGGAWAKKADMPTVRGWLCTGVVDGKIYAIGGAGELFSAGETLPTVEAYTPEVAVTAISPQGKLTVTWGRLKAAN